MANEFDKILRENFKEPKERLLKQLIPANIIRITPLVPRLQQTLLEKETDTVAVAETDEGKSFILHIEWQSSNDPKMARRMAIYDLLLNDTYEQEVLGIVLYVGNDPLRMKDNHNFFDFSYRCRMIDVRLLDPELFLQSDDAGELIFAVLTGTGGQEQKLAIIKRIMAKLQEHYAGDSTGLQQKLKQLELLSLLRGKEIQSIIIREENRMPVTIDITQDLRYQQGISEGKVEGKEEGKMEGKVEGKEEQNIENAIKMFENGLDISLVQNITGLEWSRLESIRQRLTKR